MCGHHKTLESRLRRMISTPLRPLLFICAVFAFVSAVPAQTTPKPTQTVITDVTVINPLSDSVQPHSMVVINGNRITFVSRSAAVPLAKNTHVIDGRGQFLIPGLWDMHVHSAFGDWFPGGRDIILPLFIASGVTGVRDMGGDVPVLFAWRKQIAAGELIGPRMVISGPMLDGYLPGGKTFRFPSSIPVTSVEDAVAAVDSLKAQHVDFIKVQSLIPHDAYLAAATEANKQ